MSGPSNKKQFTAISLFSGLGGDSLGLKQAGCRVIAYNEIKSKFCESHQANFPDCELIKDGDIIDIAKIRDPYFEKYKGQTDILFAGFPWRSDKPSHNEIADFLGVKTIGLQLIDPRFYHLDTALTIVNDTTVAIYPKAFSEDSIKAIKSVVPNVIEATDEDAVAYGLNSASDGKRIVIPEGATNLQEKYRALGLEVFPVPISEFQKSGGGVKCLTLFL